MSICNGRQTDFNGILLQVEFVFKIRFQMFKNEEAPFGIIVENGARCCDFHSLGIPDEEGDTQLFFQRFNHTADSRLGNVEISGSFAETFLLCHFHEIFQMTIVHSSFLLSIDFDRKAISVMNFRESFIKSCFAEMRILSTNPLLL